MKSKFFYLTLTCIFAVSFLNIGFSYQFKYIVDSITEANHNKFIMNIIVMVFIIVIMVILEFSRQSLNEIYLNEVGFKINSTLINRFFKSDLAEFGKRGIGEYISKVNNDIEMVKKYHYDTIFSLFQGIVTFLIATVALISLDKLTAMLIFVTSFLPIVVPYLFDKYLSLVQNSISINKSLYNTQLNNSLTGILVIKNSPSDSFYKDTLLSTYKSGNTLSNKRAMIVAFINAFSGFFFYAVSIVILFVGGRQVMNQVITIGALTSIINISNELVMPVNLITDSIADFNSVKGVKQNLLELFPSDIDNDKYQSVIEFKNLDINNLTYKIKGETILENINFSIDSSKKYLLTGESGKGKSTLAYLMTKNLSVHQDSILINQIPINDISYKGIQNLVAFVPQKPVIFQESYLDNLTMHQKVNPKEIMHYIHVFKLTKRFPNYESLSEIHSGETNLSGGQIQRMAIIRALLQHKPLLLLDESLSSLDKENFVAIENILLHLSELTLIHISHRTNRETVDGYDKVITID